MNSLTPVSDARSPVRVGVWRVLAFGMVGACGANVQVVHEGDVRFEHCMALDLRPEIRPSSQRTCWQDWLLDHTFGQTRDRIAHAERRVAALGGSTLAPVDSAPVGRVGP